MNQALLAPEIQAYIDDHFESDIFKLILKGSPFNNVSAKELAQQIEGRRRIKKKLPTWFDAFGIIYPPPLNLSQSSSEVMARYKSGLISGESLLDITGGFGVDSYYFSRVFKKVIYCEKNKELAELVSHNFKRLEAFGRIKTISGNSLEYLQKIQSGVDWIYADPGRRSETGQKMYRLEDSVPNVLEHLDFLFSRSGGILLKTSPLLDLHLGMEQLRSVAAIHIVAVKNEVKELLWVLRPNWSQPARIYTINFDTYKSQRFDAIWGREKEMTPVYSEPLRFLYEPNSAILKAGVFNTVSAELGIGKLATNTHLYTSSALIDFPGRRFQILGIFPFHKKNIRKMGVAKANITTRNFPLSVWDIRKKYKIAEGGEVYLFFTETVGEGKIILKCRKADIVKEEA